MKRLLLTCLVGCLMALPVLGDGPETGSIIGKVTDASGSPLPGVMVTLTGERGDKNVVTDGEGVYRFGLVPPGSYKLKAELSGFATAEGAANIVTGGKAEVDLKLRLETSEEITITSEAPLVDKYNVTAGATIEAETAGEIAATVRSFYGALQVLPGVTNDVESMDLSQSRPTVNGALWQESNTYVDGVDTTYSMRGGGTRVFLPSSALSEVSMEAGGGGAEYGRNAGSHTNLIVKSGTNSWKGDFNAVYGKQSWNSNWKPQDTLADDPRFVASFVDQGLSQAEAVEAARNWVVYQPGERDGEDVNIEAGLGGPMVRDKAWFFVSRGETSTSQLDKTLDGQLFNNSSELYADIAKLNLQPGASHSLAYTYIDAPVDRIFLLPQFGDKYVATFFDINGDVNSLSWNWSASQDVFFEAKLARQVSDENRRIPFTTEQKLVDPNFLADPSLGPFSPNNNGDAYVERLDNTWNNGWILGDGYGLNEFPREQANVAVTQFLGANHELKYGLDVQQVEWNQHVQRPNLFSVRDFQVGTRFGAANDCIGSASAPEGDTRCFMQDFNGHGLPLGTGQSDGSNTGAYIRDRFNIGGHWTFNLGLRAEQQTLENDRGREVIDKTTLSPRINAVYDFKGDGRQLLTFNTGRFFRQMPQYLVNAFLQEDWNGASNSLDLLLHVYSVNNALAAFSPEVACGILAANPALPIVSDRGPYCFSLGSVRPGEMWQMVDQGLFESDIEPPHRDEIVLGYEWQFSNNWALDAKAIWWETDNLIGSTLQRDQNFGLFQLTANYDDYADILRQLNFVGNYVDRGFGTAEEANAILDRFEDDNREYNGLQLQLNRRFRNGWAWYNNLTLSKVEGRTYGDGNGNNEAGAFNDLNDDYGRNLEATLTPEIFSSLMDSQADVCAAVQLPGNCVAALEQFIGQPLSTINRHGELPVDRPIIFKSYGYRQWIWGKQDFNLGGTFIWQSGSPYEATRSTASTPVTLLDNAQNTTINLFLTERGALDNADFYWLNLSGAYGFPLGGKVRGQVRLEVTNVTDEQEQVATSQRTGAARPSRRSFQQPRKIRLLGSVRF